MRYIFGDYTLDTARRELYHLETPIPLEPKAYQVLSYLVQNHDRLVTRDELLEHVWPDVYVDDSAVARRIQALRQSVGDSSITQQVIQTRRGQGYRFVAPVALPETLKDDPAAALLLSAPVNTSERPSVAERSKILIVDDEPVNVDLLEQELEELGYETLSASNGQEALHQVTTETPDLILLDVMMPVMDGFTVCRMLKGDETTRLIPIVIMTALDAVEDRIKGIEAGADDFLTKPVNERELLARIQTALRAKHTVDRKLGELRRAKDHFAKFVPDAVKRLVAANPEAPELSKRECDVSVLFLEITGYSRLSDQLSPHALNVIVEQYFSTFLDCIHEAGGDITETVGDGFMTVFQDIRPLFQNSTPRSHASMAADAAMALLAATDALNAEHPQHVLEVCIGLNSGTALVGSTRLGGQSGTRWTFTTRGLVTNLAARLSSFSEGGQILIGPQTAQRLGDAYRMQKLSHTQLKDIAEAIDIYSLVGLKS